MDYSHKTFSDWLVYLDNRQKDSMIEIIKKRSGDYHVLYKPSGVFVYKGDVMICRL